VGAVCLLGICTCDARGILDLELSPACVIVVVSHHIDRGGGVWRGRLCIPAFRSTSCCGSDPGFVWPMLCVVAFGLSVWFRCDVGGFPDRMGNRRSPRLPLVFNHGCAECGCTLPWNCAYHCQLRRVCNNDHKPATHGCVVREGPIRIRIHDPGARPSPGFTGNASIVQTQVRLGTLMSPFRHFGWRCPEMAGWDVSSTCALVPGHRCHGYRP
jgi:hypothetical protein